MNDEHARIGRGFRNNIREELGSLFGGSIRTKGLNDGIDIIVNGFGHTNDHDLPAMLFENVFGELGSLSVGIISSDGV